MASDGPNSAGTVVDLAGIGTKAWTNPGNATTSNNTYATTSWDQAVDGSGGDSHYLKATNFGFSIPANATIDGIVATVERKYSGDAKPTTLVLKLVKGGTIVGTDHSGDEPGLGGSWSTVDVNQDYGSPTEKWGTTWTPADINSSTFGVAMAVHVALARFEVTTVSVDSFRITVYYSLPVAPTITVGPSVSYGSWTRFGPANAATITFTASDSDDTGANALTYQLRTASGGGGSLLATGNCTHNVSKAASLPGTSAATLASGSVTLWLRVSDGSLTDESSFTILVDKVAPGTPSSVSTNPDPVTPTNQYSLTFTSADTHSTSVNELTWELATANTFGGAVIASGNATQGTISTGTFSDPTLAAGNNTRYLRTIDGANNISTVATITVTKINPQTYDETTGSVTVLTLTLGLDSQVATDTATLQLVKATSAGADSQAMTDSTPQLAKAVSAGGDSMQMAETSGSQLLLVSTGGSDAQVLSELLGLALVKAALSGQDGLVFDMTAGSALVKAVTTGSDAQTMTDLAATQLLLVTTSGSDSLSMSELATQVAVKAVLGGASSQTVTDTGGEALVLVVLTGNDDITSAGMDETMGLALVRVTLDATETWDMAEHDPLLVRADLSGWDNSDQQEQGGQVTVNVTTQGFDQQDMQEQDALALVRVFLGGIAGSLFDESAGLMVVKATLSGNDGIIFGELGTKLVLRAVTAGSDTHVAEEQTGLTVAKAVLSGVTTQLYPDTGGSAVVLTTLGGVDHQSFNELAGQQLVLATTAGQDHHEMAEFGPELVLVNLSGSDLMVMNELLGQLVVLAELGGIDKVTLTGILHQLLGTLLSVERSSGTLYAEEHVNGGLSPLDRVEASILSSPI